MSGRVLARELVAVCYFDGTERFNQWNTGEYTSRSHGWPRFSTPSPTPCRPFARGRNSKASRWSHTATISWMHEQRRVERDVESLEKNYPFIKLLMRTIEPAPRTEWRQKPMRRAIGDGW